MQSSDWVRVRRDILREPRTADEIVPAVDHIRTSSGNLIEYVHAISPYEVVFVIALDGSGRIGMIRQYRYLAGQELWEIPAGSPEGDETLEDGARRETEEELGVRVGRLEPIGTFYSSIGITNQRNHFFIGTELALVQPMSIESSISEIRWTDWDVAVELATTGRIENGGATLGILLAHRWVQRIFPKGSAED